MRFKAPKPITRRLPLKLLWAERNLEFAVHLRLDRGGCALSAAAFKARRELIELARSSGTFDIEHMDEGHHELVDKDIIELPPEAVSAMKEALLNG